MERHQELFLFCTGGNQDDFLYGMAAIKTTVTTWSMHHDAYLYCMDAIKNP
jgi:hypothetical protein